MTKVEQQQKREIWRQRVAEYRASGKSGAAWCAAQGIKPYLLYYWMQQFAPAEETGTTTLQWQPVLVNDHQNEKASGNITVRIGAAAIEVQPNFDSKALADVVRVLIAVC